MPISNRAISSIFLFFILAGAGFALADDELKIVTRQEWGAKPPVKAMPANVPMRITIHHTATKPNLKLSIAAKLKSLQVFSQKDSKLADGRLKKAWGDVPYHYYIDAKGAVAEGREVKFVGDTNTDYDPSGHIQVVVEGNFEQAPPAPAEVKTLEQLLVRLARTYHIDPKMIGVHRDFAHTECPGKYLLALLPDIKKDVARELETGTPPPVAPTAVDPAAAPGKEGK